MGTEIERKFLVVKEFPRDGEHRVIKQGYVDRAKGKVFVRDGLISFIKGEETYYSFEVGSDCRDILRDMQTTPEGELLLGDHHTCRVRIKGDDGYVTLKGEYIAGKTPEYEYQIPKHVAEILLDQFTVGYIWKTRYDVMFAGRKWEVDEFKKPVEIVMAEVEIESRDAVVALPSWVGNEVTGDVRYFNSNMVRGSLG